MSNYSVYLIILWLVAVSIRPSRKFTLALAPWLLFVCCYDWMHLLPNYEVNPVDIRGIYETEKSLFGIVCAEGKVIPGEYFMARHAPWADFLAGLFYLCWVPIPFSYALWLYFKGKRKECARMSIAFLWINLLGFVVYYIHPAAPPWYALQYGFEPLPGTPGNTAGLERFDSLLHFPVFASIYSGNSNVFAAVPSLHSAYLLTTAAYAVINKNRIALAAVFFSLSVGIWCSAIYTCHHYVIDVLLGIADAIIGTVLLECIIRYVPPARRAFDKYTSMLG